ncbi:EpsG family protein [Photobacterium leiognathi]|uniref:EpsG family protein n=1 Tax=Photobacterium leiognathi TaxID=553611 RepID=UPI003BF4EC9F|nr:EpsG family protein [Photobacterium leiognathi]
MKTIIDVFLLVFLIIMCFTFVKIRLNNKVVYFIWLFLFSTFLALRSVGDDTSSYKEIFDHFNVNLSYFSYVENGGKEIFWYYLIIFLKFFNFSNYFFLFFSALITIIPIGYIYIRKYEFKNILCFILCYTSINYFFLINGIRIAAAASIILVSLYFLCRNKKFKSLSFLFSSVFFHYSIVITWPLVFLGRSFFKNKNILFILLILYIIPLFLTQVQHYDELSFINRKIQIYLYQYEELFSYNMMNKPYEKIAIYFIYIVQVCFPVLICLFCSKVISDFALRCRTMVFVLFIFGLLLFSLSSYTLAYRIGSIGAFFTVFPMFESLLLNNNYVRKNIIIFITIIYVLLNFIYMTKLIQNIPYIF